MLSATFAYLLCLVGLKGKKSKAVSCALLLLCFILAAFSQDAYDFWNYKDAYAQVANGISTRYELLYVMLMRIGNYLGLSYEVFRAVISAGALAIIYAALRKFTEDVNFCLALGVIYPLIFLFPVQRQFIASAIILYGLSYLCYDKKMPVIKYELCVLAAAFIQSSSLFFLLVPIYRFVKNKWMLFGMSLGGSILYCVIGASILPKLIGILPIASSVAILLNSSSHANFNGILLALFSICCTTGLGFLSTFYYRKAPDLFKSVRTDAFMDMVLNLNIVAFFVMIPWYYAPASSRLLYVFLIVNYVAAAVAIRASNTKKYKRLVINRRVGLIFSAAVLTAVGILLFELFYASPQLRELIYEMHFNTNPVCKFINEFLEI